MRGALAETRFRAIIERDAGMRQVTRDDVADLLRVHQADARDAKEFRAAERDAAYSSREEGGES